MIIKAGYRTSEFWFTLVSFIFSGLYLAGILKETEHKDELISVVTHAVESIILISGQVVILSKYIKGRTEVKKIVEEKKLEETKRRPSDDKQRSSKTTSRKPSNKNPRKSTKPKKSSN